MNTLKYILISTLAILFISCQKDIMKDIKDGDWNHERSIVELEFEDQIGLTSISRDNDGNGTITFMLNTMIADLAEVKVKNIALSYGAKSDIKAGDVINFDNTTKSTFITVTSQQGEKLDWQVTANPFTEELIGTWGITGLDQYGGAGAEYGGAMAGSMTEDTKIWPDNEGADKELDNTLTFTLTGVGTDGNAYGTVVNNAGPDGAYANFVFYQDKTNNPSETYDANKFYRTIAKGAGKWKRDNAAGTITFMTDNDVVLSTTTFVGAGTENLPSQPGGRQNAITVTDKAFTFKLTGTGSWDFIYAGKDRFYFNPNKYWIQVTKIND